MLLLKLIIFLIKFAELKIIQILIEIYLIIKFNINI
jgi:hypothetical protein